MRMLLTLLALYLPGFCAAQTLKPFFHWRSPTHHIRDVSFMQGDSEIVLTLTYGIPENGDAIGREHYADSLWNYAYRHPRFEDPVVTILNLRTRKTTRIDYGMAPVAAGGDRQVIYAYPVTPDIVAQEYDSLAKPTLVKRFDRVTGRYDTLAIGAKTAPAQVLVDSQHLAYQCDSSIRLLDLATGKSKVLSRFHTVYGELQIVDDLRATGGRLFCTIHTRMGADGNAYRFQVATPGHVALDMVRYEGLFFKLSYALPVGGTLVYLDDYQQLITDKRYMVTTKNGKEVSKKLLDFPVDEEWLSPNGRYLLYSTAQQQYFVKNLRTGARVRLDIIGLEVTQRLWSADGHTLGIVERADVQTDVLSLFYIN